MPTAPPVIPRSVFDTTEIAGTRRFAAWREAISVLFDVSYDGRDDAASFPASVEAYLLGNITLAQCRAARQRFERSPLKLARDATDCYLVELFVEGRSAPRDHDGPDRCASPGDLLIIDTAQPMATATTAFHNVNLVIPRTALAPLLKAPDEHNLRVVGAGVALAGLLRDHLQALVRHVPHMERDDALATVPSTLHLVAAVLNGGFDEIGARGVRQARLGAVCRHIEQRLADPALSPAGVAAAFGLSRATLYRLFEPLGGIARYVRERRLRRILRDIADPSNRRRAIAEIALEWGFINQSDFSRAFRRQFAMTPREARQHAVAAPHKSSGADPDPAWITWVRNAR